MWIHYKGNLKRKIFNNKKNKVAGDPLVYREILLNPIERKCAELIQLFDETTNASGPAIGTISSMKQECEKSNDNIQNSESEETLQSEVTQPKATTQSKETQPKEMQTKETQPKETQTKETQHKETQQPKELQQEGIKNTLPLPRKAIELERFEALKQQTFQQAEILTTLQRIEKAALENCAISRKIYELKKTKLLIYQNQCDTANELHSLDVEYKRKKLELLEAQLAKYK